MIYTSSAPTLSIDGNKTYYELLAHGNVHGDKRDKFNRLSIRFKLADRPATESWVCLRWAGTSLQRILNKSFQLTLRFKFPQANGYWSLAEVEVQEPSLRQYTLPVVGVEPSAPIGFSYKCSKTLVFRNGTTVLTLKNVQVSSIRHSWKRSPGSLRKRQQRDKRIKDSLRSQWEAIVFSKFNSSIQAINSKNHLFQAQATLREKQEKQFSFGDAYDCVGFTSAPIWAGIFVTAIVCFVLTISLICIMEIKPPNRFESSRSKQLTFTIQE